MANFANLQERVREFAGVSCSPPLDAIQQLPEGPCYKRALLSFAHLGRCYHLHRASDLGGSADGFDAAAYITGAGHNLHRRFTTGRLPRLLEFVRGHLQISLQGLAKSFFFLDPGKQFVFSRGQEVG